MAEMSDDPNPMDSLASEVREDIAMLRACVAKDGATLDGKPHPLLDEIRQRETLLAKIYRDMN
jgi:hypothetical protein